MEIYEKHSDAEVVSSTIEMRWRIYDSAYDYEIM